MEKKRYFRFIYIIIFLIGFISSIKLSYSQDILEIKGVIEDNYVPLKNADIVLFDKYRQKISESHTDSYGIFSVKMDLNKEFYIEFRKENYVTKKLYVNSSVPDEKGGKWLVEFSIGIFENYQGLDISDLKNPVTKIIFDENKNGFDYDYDYTSKMRTKIDKILQQLEALKEKAYRDILIKADKMYDDKNYANCIDKYNEALNIRPDDKYPEKQIKRARKLLEEIKEDASFYENAIVQADMLFDKKEYIDSRDRYYTAQNYKPYEEYPKSRILKINEILKKQKEKERAELAENNKYKALISIADNHFTDKRLVQAKSKYSEAVAIKPKEQYPRNQIIKIDNLLAAKAEAAADEKAMEEAYRNAIAKADNLFNTKEYKSSKAGYKSALQIKPQEAYPKTKITEIDNILAKKAAKEQEYKNYIMLADAYFDAKKYEQS
ncbi:MAG: hypothetical protein U9R54_01325, partial [Bacteroidota bacterium]|nr:hypothetical protein [Bacteroidota bacterium]